MSNTAYGFVGSLGHPSDAATGLIYMRARYYDPGTGRFQSEDPGRHGMNWFIYAGDNPANVVDLTGKDNLLLTAIAALIGAFWGLIGGNYLYALLEPILKLATRSAGEALIKLGDFLIGSGDADEVLADVMEAGAVEMDLTNIPGYGDALHAGAGMTSMGGIGQNHSWRELDRYRLLHGAFWRQLM